MLLRSSLTYTTLLYIVFGILIVACSDSQVSQKPSAPIESKVKGNLNEASNLQKEILYYDINPEEFSLVSKDSSSSANYQYPQIYSLNNKEVEDKVNALLKSQFIPNENFINAFERNTSKRKKKSSSASYWETIKVNFSIGLALENFITIKKEFVIENEGMSHPVSKLNYYNIDLENGNLIETLDYFFVDGFEEVLENQLNIPSEEEDEDRDFFINFAPTINYEFGFIEENDEINLEIYIPPFADFAILKAGKVDIISNDYESLFYSASLNDFAELIKPSSVFNGITVK